MKSDQINELAAALAKAQSEMSGAKLDAANPHLRNKYASLASYIEAARKPLTDNGLAFVQVVGQSAKGVVLETILMHSSGQWIQGKVLVDPSSLANKGINDVQALGSALTYYKRFALASMLGISVENEDDDGNSSGKAGQQKAQPKAQQPQKPTNGKVPTTGLELLAMVNEKTDPPGYYESSTHLRNAIRKASGDPNWDFPPKDDVDGWRSAYRLSLDHAKAPRPQAVEQPELA